MSDNGNQPGVKIAETQRRVRASGPILILAVLFVAATFLAWYFTWFGRGLSDADITRYLGDEKNPRHVQHALLQIQERLNRGDASAKIWYPQLIALSMSQETEFRLTVAWLMGFDNQSSEFHRALSQLLLDKEPIVRRNAALALVRFNDDSGRPELLSILQPYPVIMKTSGVVASILSEGSEVARGSLLARIEENNNPTEVRSPLPGKIYKVRRSNGSRVVAGEELLTLNSDEESIWESLRGLALIGERSDLSAIERYSSDISVSSRVKQQAELTVQAIQNRTASK